MNAGILISALHDAQYYLLQIRGAVWWHDGETLVTAEELAAKIDLAIATFKVNEARGTRCKEEV